MSSVHVRERVPVGYVGVLVVAILATFAYAVLAAQVVAWFFGLLAIASFGLSLFVVYLLYRLVLAVERIADSL